MKNKFDIIYEDIMNALNNIENAEITYDKLQSLVETALADSLEISIDELLEYGNISAEITTPETYISYLCMRFTLRRK